MLGADPDSPDAFPWLVSSDAVCTVALAALAATSDQVQSQVSCHLVYLLLAYQQQMRSERSNDKQSTVVTVVAKRFARCPFASGCWQNFGYHLF